MKGERVLNSNHILFSKVHDKSKNVPPKIFTNEIQPPQLREAVKHRQTRSDKIHDIKFPVTLEEKIRFKIALNKAVFFNQKLRIKDRKITQTLFNTALFRYALNIQRSKEFVVWERKYADSPYYMHIKPREWEYDDVGGIFGLSTIKGMSDRKTAFCIVMSALESIERNDKYYESVLRYVR